MNESMSPEEDRPDERPAEVPPSPQKQPPQPRTFGWGTALALLAVVGVCVLLLLPTMQHSATPATRSSQLEMEQRQLEIEQAALEAQHEDERAER